MYQMPGSSNQTTSLFSQLVIDDSGELMQSLQVGLQGAVERAAEATTGMNHHSADREIAEFLPPVFAAAQDILDKAALAVARARQAR